MWNEDHTQARGGVAEGARDLQAKLYREIGISAVAAALHSISKPAPAAGPAKPAVRPIPGRTVRAA